MPSTIPRGRGLRAWLERKLLGHRLLCTPEALDALSLSSLQLRVASDELLLRLPSRRTVTLVELAGERLPDGTTPAPSPTTSPESRCVGASGRRSPRALRARFVRSAAGPSGTGAGSLRPRPASCLPEGRPARARQRGARPPCSPSGSSLLALELEVREERPRPWRALESSGYERLSAGASTLRATEQ